MDDATVTSPAQAVLLQVTTAQLAVQDASARFISASRAITRRDDPSDFAAVRVLSSRLGDVISSDTGLSQALGEIEAASAGIDALGSLVAQLEAVAESAIGGSVLERAIAARQFDAILSAAGLLGEESALAGTPTFGDDVGTSASGGTFTLASELGFTTNARLFDAMSARFFASLSSGGLGALVDEGVASGASLGIGTAASFNGFATDADIEDALDALDDVRVGISSAGVSFMFDAASALVRDEAGTNISGPFRVAIGSATTAPAAETASTLAADVRARLGTAGLAISSEGRSLLLDLLGAP